MHISVIRQQPFLRPLRCECATWGAPRKTGWLFEDSACWLVALVRDLPPHCLSCIITQRLTVNDITGDINIYPQHIRRKQSKCCRTYHFIRNMSSPELSVAPMILSGCRPRSNPRALFSSYHVHNSYANSHQYKANKYWMQRILTITFSPQELSSFS